MITYIILGITIGFAASVQPGPYQTFLISRTLQDGWRRALPAAFACLLSDMPAAALSLLLLTSLPAWTENLLYLVGGLFVLFLAYGAFRSFRRYSFSQPALLRSGRQNFLGAVGVNLLNPNPYLEWAFVVGPLLLKALRESTATGIAFVASLYVAIVLTCAGIILLCAGVGRLFPKVNRVLLGISVVALAAFGCFQLWLGLSSLLSA